jgi:phage shock protein B
MFFSRMLIPLGAFVMVVMIVWIRSHYRAQRYTARGLSSEDAKTLAALAASADRIDRRIEALEKVLDAEVPGWRSKS